MTAELAARRTAAAAVRTDFERESRAYAIEGAPVPDWATWAQRLSIALAGLLDSAEDGQGDDGPVLLGEVVDGLRAEVVDAIDVALSCSRAARQLGAIRAVLARVLDSEHSDRQMALEEIDRIATPVGEL